MKRGGVVTTQKRENRSSTLKGRISKRKGKNNIPRAAQLQGLIPRAKPDPNLKPWPDDCLQIVAATPMTVNVAGIREHIVDAACGDCRCRLAMDSYSIRVAMEMPERQRRPLRFICVRCYAQYDRLSIQKLIDNRTTIGTNEGTELDQ